MSCGIFSILAGIKRASLIEPPLAFLTTGIGFPVYFSSPSLLVGVLLNPLGAGGTTKGFSVGLTGPPLKYFFILESSIFSPLAYCSGVILPDLIALASLSSSLLVSLPLNNFFKSATLPPPLNDLSLSAAAKSLPTDCGTPAFLAILGE